IVGLPGVWMAMYEKRKLAQADERERLEIERKKLAKEQKRVEKELRKKKVAPAEASEAESDEEQEEAEEDLADRPEPQIIDTALAKPKKGAKQPEKLTPRTPVSFENYELPDLDLLDAADLAARPAADPNELKEIQATLIDTLAQF